MGTDWISYEELGGAFGSVPRPLDDSRRLRLWTVAFCRLVFSRCGTNPKLRVPEWFTPRYADRAWDRMPVLADALEEVGCDDARVLGHCHDYPVHARGCGVVDAILGKS